MPSPVLPDNRPKYVEDFRITGPDAFNDFSPTGDPDPEVDWWPAFARASVHHLNPNSVSPTRFQDTYAPTIYVGRTRSTYRLSKRLDCFVSLEGLYGPAAVVLSFYNNSDGVVIHHPTTSLGAGTLTPSLFSIPTSMQPYEGWGSLGVTLRNIRLDLSGAAGTRGLIVYRRADLFEVGVRNAGWHGIHIDADVLRAVGTSNANYMWLDRCYTFQVGGNPGTNPVRVSPWNPTGANAPGAGLRIRGGDANIFVNFRFDGTYSAGPEIHDSGFLGNTHFRPHALPTNNTLGGYIRTQAQEDIFNGATQWLADNLPGGALATSDPDGWAALRENATIDQQEYRPFGFAVGARSNVAFVMDNANARGRLVDHYIEGQEALAVIYLVPPNYREHGIGGVDDPITRSRDHNGALGPFRVGPALGTPHPTAVFPTGPAPGLEFGELNEVLARLKSNAAGDTSAIRLKYRGYYGNNQVNGGPFGAGWFMVDSRNSANLIGLMVSTGLSRWFGRTIEEGRIMIPQRLYFSQKRLDIVAASDVNSPELPALPGDYQAGDMALALGTSLSPNLAPGQNILYVVVDNNGTLAWEGRL